MPEWMNILSWPQAAVLITFVIACAYVLGKD